jgi:hypothetical protein
MKKLLPVLLLLVLIACGTNNATLATAPKAGFHNIKDIPMPESAQIDLVNSVIVGPETEWMGQLIYSSNKNPVQIFELYTQNLASFGWEKVSITRGKNSHLIYQKGNRIINITIKMTNNMFSKTFVEINMSNTSA